MITRKKQRNIGKEILEGLQAIKAHAVADLHYQDEQRLILDLV